MPGQYDAENRTITLNTELQAEPYLTTTTLIRFVVCDLLHVSKCEYAHLPEVVDLAVVTTGLGMLQSNINLVTTGGSFWDTTRWDVYPPAFLGHQSLAYASAVTAWVRDDKAPRWANDLPSDIKKGMLKSLKFLLKTHDSFFDGTSDAKLKNSQHQWLEVAASKSLSQQLIAIRQFEVDDTVADKQQDLLIDKLRLADPAVLLHAIAAVERMKLTNDAVIDDLRMLLESRETKVRAKAMCALTKMAKLDDDSINAAAKMLDAKANFEIFAGIYALSSQETISPKHLPAVDRGFARALQICNYEFIGLYAGCYNRWLDDPKAHFHTLLEQDSPEYLEVALEALDNLREQMVSLEGA